MLFDVESEGGDFGAQEENLMKALYAGNGSGYGSLGGRSLIPENVDASVVMALRSSPEDFKVMNLLKKNIVLSPVNEYVREKGVGESDIFYNEGEEVEEDTVDLERVARTSKYMQTYRKVSMQLEKAKTIEGAVAVEKIAGIHHLLEGCESACFHGDSAINAKQFDSIPKQIVLESRNAGRNTVYDLRGRTMLSDGESAINAVAQLVCESGGTLTHSMMPPAIAADLHTALKDKLLLTPSDKMATNVPIIYPTMFGDRIVISGESGGANKFYRMKGKITASTHSQAPTAPTLRVTPEGNGEGSKFAVSDAGRYWYQAYAFDTRGRYSQAATVSAAATVAGNGKVTLSITGGDNKAIGYVLCRSKKDATSAADCREFARIAKDSSGTTTYTDLNEDIPGTGEMLLLSMRAIKPAVRWNQFMPATKVDMAATKSLVIPFIIAMFGSPDVQVPWYNGLIKNIGYSASGF